jgi:RNA polymerase sigma-70 factor, ECF subfamily
MQVDLGSDEAILDKFQQTKDPALFKSLVRRFQNRLFNAAYRILGNAEEAEEIVQDTCIKMYQSIDKFSRSSSLAAWVFRIAHNSCLDTLRLKQRKRALTLVAFDPQANSGAHQGPESGLVVCQAADPGPGPAEILDSGEQGRVIAEKLAELPDNQRTVLVLHDIEGFSYLEIAEITGEKVGTVRSRLHYGRQRMKELLEPYYVSNTMSKGSR